MSVRETVDSIKEQAQALEDSGASPGEVRDFLEATVKIAMGDQEMLKHVYRNSLPGSKHAAAFVQAVGEFHNLSRNLIRRVLQQNADLLIQAVDRFGLRSLADMPDTMDELIARSPDHNPGCRATFNEICGIMRDKVNTGWVNSKTGAPDNVANAGLASGDPDLVDLSLRLQAIWNEPPESLEKGFRQAFGFVGIGPKLAGPLPG